MSALQYSLTVYLDTSGQPFPLDSCARTKTYNETPAILTDVATDPVSGKQWTQTYTYTGDNLTGVSGWVPTAFKADGGGADEPFDTN